MPYAIHMRVTQSDPSYWYSIVEKTNWHFAKQRRLDRVRWRAHADYGRQRHLRHAAHHEKQLVHLEKDTSKGVPIKVEYYKEDGTTLYATITVTKETFEARTAGSRVERSPPTPSCGGIM